MNGRTHGGTGRRDKEKRDGRGVSPSSKRGPFSWPPARPVLGAGLLWGLAARPRGVSELPRESADD